MQHGNTPGPSQVPTDTPFSRNEKNLRLRLGFDLIASCSAAICVAPAVMTIDKAIIQNVSGQATLVRSLTRSCSTLLIRPHQIIFSKPFFFITLVYGGTYLTANVTDTLSSNIMNLPVTDVTSGAAKFIASSIANVGLGLFKDAKFAQLFGPKMKPLIVPSSSLTLFTLRDCLTIFASFNVPTLMGPYITRQLSPELQQYLNGQTISQFAAPAAVQLLSTPLHLLGLDLYNRQDPKIHWRQRWLMIKKNWALSAMARMARIMPAFGIGGIVNAGVRENLMKSKVSDL